MWNLLSVSRICKSLQYVVTFFFGFYVVEGQQRKNLISVGRCDGGLYQMGTTNERKAMVTITDTWHKRVDRTTKEKLSRIKLVKNMGN